MILPLHLRNLITDTLKSVNLYSESAVELLMLTAAQESHCGRWLEQVGGGPALGIFQMEPSTYHDLWNNFLTYGRGPERARVYLNHVDVDSLFSSDLELRGNIPYQIIAARLHYYRFPAVLPSANNIEGLAAYYKKYWNTSKGAATIEEAIANYKKYAI